jgi:hypothetical protein
MLHRALLVEARRVGVEASVQHKHCPGHAVSFAGRPGTTSSLSSRETPRPRSLGPAHAPMKEGGSLWRSTTGGSDCSPASVRRCASRSPHVHRRDRVTRFRCRLPRASHVARRLGRCGAQWRGRTSGGTPHPEVVHRHRQRLGWATGDGTFNRGVGSRVPAQLRRRRRRPARAAPCQSRHITVASSLSALPVASRTASARARTASCGCSNVVRSVAGGLGAHGALPRSCSRRVRTARPGPALGRSRRAPGQSPASSAPPGAVELHPTAGAWRPSHGGGGAGTGRCWIVRT